MIPDLPKLKTLTLVMHQIECLYDERYNAEDKKRAVSFLDGTLSK
jgi:hypothetical protein